MSEQEVLVSDDCRNYPCHKSMEALDWQAVYGLLAKQVVSLRKRRRGAEVTEPEVMEALAAVSAEYRADVRKPWLKVFRMGFDARWDDEDFTHAQRWDRTNPYFAGRQDSSCLHWFYIVWRFGWHAADKLRAPEELRTPTGRMKKDAEQKF